MDSRDRSTLVNVVAWIALVLSVIALVLAWVAYNNSSEENLGDIIQNQVQDALPNETPDPTNTNDNNLNNDTMNGTTEEGAVTPQPDDSVNSTAPDTEEEAVRPEATN